MHSNLVLRQILCKFRAGSLVLRWRQSRKELCARPPFTLLSLESIACGEPSVAAVYAGYMCALIYARLRFSDLQMCYHEPLRPQQGRGEGGTWTMGGEADKPVKILR